ncbi:ribosomal RNA-processing protein 7 homolog A-like [Ornithodoros turicata]
MAPSSAKGFLSLPVKFSAESSASHFLFFKEHNIRETDNKKPLGRTLFVVGVPPCADKGSLRRLFTEFGNVSSVLLQKVPSSGQAEVGKAKFFSERSSINGFKVAYVVFQSTEGLESALAANTSEPRVLCSGEAPISVGMQKWCDDYKSSFVDVDQLQRKVDAYMEDYDKRIEEEKTRAKETEGVPDEEGWTTVTKYGKRPVIPRTDAIAKKIDVLEKKKRSRKELLNFYTFQIRQSKMDHIANLRKKFEEDKKRIAIMKSARRFKPV